MYESLLGIKNIVSGFDDTLSDAKNNKEKVLLLRKLFVIEVKYNLDLINVLKLNSLNNDKTQLKEVIELLSFEALEEMIKYEGTNSCSFITNSLRDKILESFENISENNEKSPLDNESIILNLYKRLRTLKALNQVSTPYTVVKNINYKVRLKNLRSILLELSNINTDNA